jgi:uncharacterized lipoprotein YmbA
MRFWTHALLLGLLAGCASRPPQNVFVLGATTAVAPGVRDDTGRRVIEVKPVLIPDHLDTTDILLRTGSNELTASPTGIWGERLSIGITQALTSALARRVPSASVVDNPPATRPALQVLVDITALEVRPGGDCVLTARWTILRSRSDAGLRQATASAQGSFVTHAEAGDAGVVAAINAAIDQLADQVAIQLQ